MKNVVVSYIKGGVRIMYLKAISLSSKEFSPEYRAFRKRKGRASDRTLYDIQHRLRVKSIIYGCIFHTYHPDMDFTNAVNAGWIKEE